jgi:hypothetical protein
MTAVSATVQTAARRLGVDVADVVGTGVGGRVSLLDVQRAAASQQRGLVVAGATRRRRPAVRVVLNDPWRAGPIVSAVLAEGDAVPPGAVAVSAWDLNPLVAYVNQTAGPGYGEPPGLFSNGDDVPLFTASGIEPADLLRAPFLLRHALAACPSRADAFAIQEVSVDEAAFGEPRVEKFGRFGWGSYVQRCWAWATAQPPPEPLTDDEMTRLFGESPEEDGR